jgi:hypothetical protein
MTKTEAFAKAMAGFDKVVADRELSNITAMLADGVDPTRWTPSSAKPARPCGSRGRTMPRASPICSTRSGGAHLSRAARR